MRLLALALICAPSLAAATCPPLPARSAAQDQLMEQVRAAGTETLAQELNTRLWEIWTTAPDAAAQEMLDSGMSRRASFDFLGAKASFDALIAYCPHYAEGYNQRAFVSFLREDYPAALVDLDKTLEITPDHIGAASGKALTLLRMGRDVEGQLALRHALTMNPWLPERFQLKAMEDVRGAGSDTDL
ncbi:hypothetical protein [uncultured Litoreibacter sp.]|uniref:tetratricopeptide repeat protein n=1 Tax=uncultured Litoreibacter sp. TaxID=1392394 RepID=UPI002614EC98|nr:hypothetical protein [uncultured Litoreibacter sp.]